MTFFPTFRFRPSFLIPAAALCAVLCACSPAETGKDAGPETGKASSGQGPSGEGATSGIVEASASPEALTDRKDRDSDVYAPARIMVVLDSSGSMWGQIDGKPKYLIAREALEKVLPGLPQNAQTGLMAYGHRSEGDCDDIEILAAPAAGAAAGLGQKAASLRPTGKTPLTEAVRRAAVSVQGKNARPIVVLITDGVETCNADPCALGAQLAAGDTRVVTHVIGFGLSKAEGQQVACLAEETGGRYLPADDAASLEGALEKVADTLEAPAAPPPQPSVEVTAPAEVTIGANFEAGWALKAGSPAEYDRLELHALSDGVKDAAADYDYVRPEEGQSVSLKAPVKAGDYEVRYVFGGDDGNAVLARAPVRVVESDVMVSAPAEVGIGADFQVEWRGPAGEYDTIGLSLPGQSETTDYGFVSHANNGPMTLRAPSSPGDYELRYELSGAGSVKRTLATAPIRVVDVPVELAFDPKAIMGDKLSVTWRGPNSEYDTIGIFPVDAKDDAPGLDYGFVRHANPVKLSLPVEPGEYQVRYVINANSVQRVLARAPVSVAAATATIASPAKASVGQPLTIAWTGPGGDSDRIAVTRRGDRRTGETLDFAYTPHGDDAGKPVELKMPNVPGDYDFIYILYGAGSQETILATRPVRIDDVPASVDLVGAARAGQPVKVKWTGPGHQLDQIGMARIGATAEDLETYAYAPAKGAVAEFQAPDEPGRYELRYVMSGQPGARIVAVGQVDVR